MSLRDPNIAKQRRIAIVLANPATSTTAVRDGNLITGRQNFCGAETAALIIETLGR